MKNISIKSIQFLLLLSISLVIIKTDDSLGNLILLKDAQSARCLDGSPVGYYYFQGTGEGSNKFLIYLQGGGSCEGQTNEETLESCFKRSKTHLGSSKGWSKTLSNQANLSNDQSLNPSFYNWNKIFVKYCDGHLYQGSAKPIKYNDVDLYFRGYDNMVEIFNNIINNSSIQQSQIVVLSGGSAGGLGTFFWSQYLRKVINPQVTVIAAPDSGFFVDYKTEDLSQKYQYLDLITDGNRNIIQPEGCPYLFNNETAYTCFFPENIIDQIPVPVFIINSLYDSYALSMVLRVNCVTSQEGLENCSSEKMKEIEFNRNYTLELFKKIQKNKPNWGIWAISCLYHVFSEEFRSYNGSNYQVPMNSGVTVSFALKSYIDSILGGLPSNSFHIDNEVYPNNVKCNGLNQDVQNFIFYQLKKQQQM